METVTFVLNGKQVNAAPGETILQAARRYGVYIPALCYGKGKYEILFFTAGVGLEGVQAPLPRGDRERSDRQRGESPYGQENSSPRVVPSESEEFSCIEGVSPIGACRLCVVEIEGAKTLAASCHTPAQEGMVVTTDSEKARAARRVIIELLLAAHSGDCLVCDNANTCELRNLAAELGVGRPRFRARRRFYPLEDTSACIFRDLTKCISCWRCVRACRELAKKGLLSIGYRGSKNKVIADTDAPLNKKECQSCEECIKVCPVGAVKRPSERFHKRRGQETRVIK